MIIVVILWQQTWATSVDVYTWCFIGGVFSKRMWLNACQCTGAGTARLRHCWRIHPLFTTSTINLALNNTCCCMSVLMSDQVLKVSLWNILLADKSRRLPSCSVFLLAVWKTEANWTNALLLILLSHKCYQLWNKLRYSK